MFVLSKFDHTFNFVMLISKKMERSERYKDDVVQALFLVHRIEA